MRYIVRGEDIYMKFGYMRVSTLDQNLDRQKKQLEEFGCERIFFEKVTGTKRDRPEMNRMLEFLRAGDGKQLSDI
jgi:DNA invertase Pin-like site-specific DNA recombinase